MTTSFLFNFAASYLGGGFKRLHAYANWFNQNGGACFIIHSRCASLVKEFPANRYFLVSQSRLQRLFNDGKYLKRITKELGRPDVYYSYGIPLYMAVGRINWFHLSNVLPLGLSGVPLPLFDKMKLTYLGFRITRHLKNADIISAESQFSLSLINAERSQKCVVSVNGSDDEIGFLQSGVSPQKANSAVVVGTYRYKALEDAYRVFEMLHEKNPALTFTIIGDEKKVSSRLRVRPHVKLTGSLPQQEVISLLREAAYYISTTHIENSYNAASEGIFFANESYISDIGPHRELIGGMPCEKLSLVGMQRDLLRVKREDLSAGHLKNWDKVITEMIDHVC